MRRRTVWLVVVVLCCGGLYWLHARWPVKSALTAGEDILFADALDGADRIVTNEYVYWNKDGCPYTSPVWEMTSGTLLVRQGAGWSGPVTKEPVSVCNSAKKTNSYTFRLNTKRKDFKDVKVSFAYKMVRHGGTQREPVNSYDGLHVWVRYQSQYALYAVSVSRWGGQLAIKKKVPVGQAHCPDPANEGCYYDLVAQVARPDVTAPMVWHSADVSIVNNSRAQAVITLVVDKQRVLTATDTGAHAAVYGAGAVGIRGDNTEFYIKDFAVRQASQAR